MNNSKSLRLIFFGIGLVAVVALTGLNVYSLYELQENTIESAKDHKRNQVEEFTHQVRHRFHVPFRDIRKQDIEYLQTYYNEHGVFPESFLNVILQTSKDRIFSEIYYSPHEANHCLDSSDPVFRFDPASATFVRTNDVSELVCDGFGLSRSRMRALINDYRWNNNAVFDTHRSMTLSMINPAEREVIGHLNFVINREYLINEYLSKELVEKFGAGNESGTVVWLHDYILGETLASSDPSVEYSREIHIDVRQGFPEVLDNWLLLASITDSPAIAASNASLVRNLFVLGFAVVALFGALAFMFFTSKRERELIQRQSGFLANVTHELKTPLATMQAAGENLSDGRVIDSERIKAYGNHIYNETLRLRKMIEKLLDSARMDAGQSRAQMTVQDLGELVRSAYNTHWSYVTTNGFKFDLKVEPDLPNILADVEHIETIISNLIDNAIKYSSDRKHISLRVKRAGRFVSFTIRDRGLGIPRRAQKQIFDKFYRVEDSMTAKTKGHGLGLSIVKNLVDLNHGKIHVQSTEKSGTSFIIEFPSFEVNETNGHSAKYTQGPRENLENELEITSYVNK